MDCTPAFPMVRITPQRRVIGETIIPLPLSARTVWGQLRDFQSSASHDPFHAGLQIDGHVPRTGARLVLEHRFLGWRARRVGRILRWREGEGYAFSDLSERGPHHGFPHVLSIRVLPIDPQRCTLQIRVTGRWTTPGPRWLGWLWLTWVLGHVRYSMRNRLLWFAIARKINR